MAKRKTNSEIASTDSITQWNEESKVIMDCLEHLKQASVFLAQDQYDFAFTLLRGAHSNVLSWISEEEDFESLQEKCDKCTHTYRKSLQDDRQGIKEFSVLFKIELFEWMDELFRMGIRTGRFNKQNTSDWKGVS